jgi:hypothetical protein
MEPAQVGPELIGYLLEAAKAAPSLGVPGRGRAEGG